MRGGLAGSRALALPRFASQGRAWATTYVALAALSVQGGAAVAVGLIADIGPLPTVWLRLGIGALILAVLRPFWRSTVDGRGWRAALLLGLALAAMNASFYEGIARIPLGVAVTLEFWGPLTLGVLGSRRALDVVWVILAAAGIFILAGGRLVADDALGVMFALIAGGCWALYIVAGARLGEAWPDGRGLGASMVVGGLILAVPAIVAGGSSLPRAGVLASGTAVAVFSSVIPYTLEMAALRRIAPSVFGVLMSLEPAIATGVGVVALGQVLRPEDPVAIAMVVAASAGASLRARPGSAAAAAEEVPLAGA